MTRGKVRLRATPYGGSLADQILALLRKDHTILEDQLRVSLQDLKHGLVPVETSMQGTQKRLYRILRDWVLIVPKHHQDAECVCAFREEIKHLRHLKEEIFPSLGLSNSGGALQIPDTSQTVDRIMDDFPAVAIQQFIVQPPVFVEAIAGLNPRFQKNMIHKVGEWHHFLNSADQDLKKAFLDLWIPERKTDISRFDAGLEALEILCEAYWVQDLQILPHYIFVADGHGSGVWELSHLSLIDPLAVRELTRGRANGNPYLTNVGMMRREVAQRLSGMV